MESRLRRRGWKKGLQTGDVQPLNILCVPLLRHAAQPLIRKPEKHSGDTKNGSAAFDVKCPARLTQHPRASQTRPVASIGSAIDADGS